jgi:hypothetical protein
MSKVIEGLAIILMGIAIIVMAGALFSLPVYFLWNGCLVGAVDGVHEVSWMQAFGLTILFSFLFKSTSTTK